MKGRRAALALIGTLGLAGCATRPGLKGPVAASSPSYPAAVFAVLSDLHVYDRELGDTGAAFEQYLREDRKLLRESVQILDTALRLVDATDARFLLVAGDLTKDGELASHEIVVDYLEGMERTGRQVWVVPGNHDLRNPDAVRFLGDTTERVPSVEPEELAVLYADFGYNQALERDPASLSYLAEPAPGLWLLALDATDTARNFENGEPEVDGRFSAATTDWIAGVLARALDQGKAVIALMHHGLVPHFASQEKYFGDYLVDRAPEVAHLLARAGVRVAFTGHFHAQDVALRRWDDGSFLYDIETGSLVTWPNPVRLIRILSDGVMSVRSLRVDRLPSYEQSRASFERYARETAHAGIAEIAVDVMTDLGMRAEEAATLSGQIADAVTAHYAGDETFEGDEILTLRGLSLMGRLVVGARKRLVYDLWEDPEPPDNRIDIRLEDGLWTSPGSGL